MKNRCSKGDETMKKRLVIKSKFRFCTFIFIVVMLITGTFGLVSAKAVDINQPETVTVNVQPGDTLWDIAKDNTAENVDIREYIYDICQLNDISADQLYSGMTIKLPVTD